MAISMGKGSNNSNNTMVGKFTTKGCSEDCVFSAGDTTLKVYQLVEKLQAAFTSTNIGSMVARARSLSGVKFTNWLTDGIDCELLTPGGKGWQKGKMRLKVNVEVEFIPDEPEPKKNKPASPLDDLRQKLRDET